MHVHTLLPAEVIPWLWERADFCFPNSQELFYMSGNHTPAKLAQALKLGGKNYK